MKKRKLTWKELPQGDILEPGTSLNFQTGDWRSQRPVHNKKTCTNCLLCWIYCPDSAIRSKNSKFDKIDLRYCKGCGICAKVCPTKPKSIQMENEENKYDSKK